MSRRNDNFDRKQHDYNVDRRIMERMFGSETKNKYKDDSDDYDFLADDNQYLGEITGEQMDMDDMDKGMPIRSSNSNKKQYEEPSNPYLDFALYDNKSKINVSYNDPFSKNFSYSSVTENSKVLYHLNSKSNEETFAELFNNFTFDFFDKFTLNLKTKKEMTLSPFNILQTLCLLYIGSKNNTEKELCNYFALPNKKTTHGNLYKIVNEMLNTNSISMTNLICFPPYVTINDAYLSYINKLGYFVKYNSRNAHSDSNKINNIVSKSTNGIVNNLIESNVLANYSVLTLISTLYFNSNWKTGFNPLNTKMEIFNGINKRNVNMMVKYNDINRYYEDNMNQILEMDFIGNNFCMGFILPKSNYGNPVITHKMYDDYMAKFKNIEVGCIKIPKFKAENRYRIDNLFKKYGLKEIFGNADLSDIIPPMNEFPINVTNMTHCAVVIINEEGGKTMQKPIKPGINFIANHQFMYYIKFKPYNAIILVGQYY